MTDLTDTERHVLSLAKGEPRAFYHNYNIAALALTARGLLEVVGKMPPLGTTFVQTTPAGRAALEAKP